LKNISADNPIAVTGAGGFIGRRLVQLLRDAGHTCLAWTRQTGDLCDATAVRKVMDGFRPGIIFHLAASTPGSDDINWRLAANEVLMFSNLLASAQPSCKIIVAGSMSEFGRSGTFSESSICEPDSAYGFAKNCVVNAALASRSTLRRDVRVARLFGVYGPGENRSRLVPYLVRELLAHRSVELRDPRQLRDFIHVDDVCRILIALASTDDPQFDLVNVGTGQGVYIGDACNAVADILQRDRSLLKFNMRPPRSIDYAVQVADTQKLSRLIAVPTQHWLDGRMITEYAGSLVTEVATSKN
jgi:nucleoside-diphosphate-sugar epimerase